MVKFSRSLSNLMHTVIHIFNSGITPKYHRAQFAGLSNVQCLVTETDSALNKVEIIRTKNNGGGMMKLLNG